jgi:hypothetical protein
MDLLENNGNSENMSQKSINVFRPKSAANAQMIPKSQYFRFHFLLWHLNSLVNANANKAKV